MFQVFDLKGIGEVRRNPWRVAAFHAAVFLLINYGAFAQESPSSANAQPKPAARIELSNLGYQPASRMDRLSEDQSSVSLDFVDANHVLLTFNRKKLFQRLPGCPPGHEDRIMHAAILEVSSGKVMRETDWYLHDRRRYLWPLGAGKLLLRKLNNLYVVDSSLNETLLMSSPKDLSWVTVTPDADEIIVETAATNSSKGPNSVASAAAAAPKFSADFLDAKTLASERSVPFDRVVTLQGTSTGYADMLHRNDIWLIRFGPSPSKRRNITRVRSRTLPDVFYASNNMLLVGRCSSPNCDYSVTAFTVTGHRLWQQHWSRYRAFPAIARNRDNSRFGVSTLQLANGAPSVAGNNVDEDDVNRPPISQLDVFEQNVQIIEAASGTAVLSVNVTPAVMSGQNFALSADGAHLAILQDQAIELFDLPPPSEQERVLFSALPTEVTDSFTTASGEDSRTQTPDATAEAGSPETPAAAPVLPPEAQQEKSNPAGVTESALTPSATDRPNPASASQSTASSGDPHTAPITFRVSTRVVAVDVVVTDGKGRPVKGLSQHDFQLAEDGKPQAVRFFREFGDAAQSPAAPPPAPAAVVAPAKSSANVFSNSVHSSEPGALTMILFDLLNTPSQDQVYARQQLIKFLRSKPKESQLALCAMTGDTSHLRLLQGFTADETRLLAAARGKKDSPKAVRWQMAASETEHTVDTVGDLAQGGPMSGFQGLLSAVQGMRAEQEVTDTQSRASITMDSMMVLATYLAGIPGRKNVVWLSGSFPISITATTNSGDLSLDNPNYTAKIKRVTNLLAEAQVAVYPVDVRGILAGGLSAGNAGGMGGPSSTSPADFSANSVISPTPNIPQDMQGLAREAAERDTLTQFAVATGGKAFYNSNGIADAIETAVEQGSNYYTFSYTPANAVYDGKFRKIKVQLAQKGYTLHYRQGYYADDSHSTGRDTELARRTRAAAMQHGTPPSHQLLFSVRVIPVGSKKKIDRVKLGDVLTPSKAPNPPAAIEMQHYIVDYSIQGSELRFVPLANAGYRNVLTLMATSFDIDGQMLTGLSNVGTNDLRPEIYEKVISGEFGVQQEVDIPATAAFLRLGIQDQMTSHIGTVEIPLPVPPVPDPPRRARIKLPDIEPD